MKEKRDFFFAFPSVFITSDFLEGKMHLGNERKKGFSLGLHYL